MTDLGAGGVKIGQSYEADQPYDEKDEQALSSHQTICDCLIAQAGRMHPGAVGIWIGHSPYNRIEHNEITDLYYTAVSVGWVWGYAHSHAHHNIIAFNHIHHICQHVLDDMGAVYALGVSPGTIIRNNLIHDVNAFAYGGGGLYLDQGASDIIVMDNVCYRCNGEPFCVHYGKDNYVTNNIFAGGRLGQIRRSKQEEHDTFVFEHNIVYWKNAAPLFQFIRKTDRMEVGLYMDHNLYWNASGHPVLFKDDTFEQWQHKGRDIHSIIADPMFLDPDNDDFRMKPGSPAERIGFHAIDLSRIGRRTKEGEKQTYAPARSAFPINFSIEDFREVMDKRFDNTGPIPADY